MHPFSIFPSIAGNWPFSYCHDIGHNVWKAVKYVLRPANYYQSSDFASTSVCLFAAGQLQRENVGAWLIQTRFHFGHQLSRYFGVSIFINTSRLAAFARASGLILLVGVGSYIAYRLCLKLLGCQDLASLIQYLCKGNSTGKQDANIGNDHETISQCRRCRARKRGEIGNSPTGNKKYAKCKRCRRSSYIQGEYCDRETVSTSNSSDLDENTTASTDLEYDFNETQETKRCEGVTPSTVWSRRWRNSVGQRTNALDDPNHHWCSTEGSSDGDIGSVKGFRNSRSPPPIHRSTKSSPDHDQFQSTPIHFDTGKCHSVQSIRSIQSSQQYNWDPICTPDPISDESLACFADVPTSELVQRFLDGLFLSNDQIRVNSPGPSEAASEFSVAMDKQIGNGTAENFEHLQYDLLELRTDMDDLDAELTTYLQERNECLTSDCRLFYHSVIVDDVHVGPSDVEDSDTSSPHVSPIRRVSIKRQRRSLDLSSEISMDEDSEKKSKRRRNYSGEERRFSMDDYQWQWKLEKELISENSGLSLDTGYMSSYHTLWSSVNNTPFSPDSSSGHDYSTETHSSQHGKTSGDLDKKRPTTLPLDRFSFSMDAEESGDSTLDSMLSLSSRQDAHWNERPPSSLSLEWDDELTKATQQQFEMMNVMEFLRVYYNVDELEYVPRIHEFWQTLVKLGYEKILLSNDIRKFPEHRRPFQAQKSSNLDNLVMASLVGATYFRWAIFKCQSFQIVPEAVDVSMKRCSFFTERCSSYFGSTNAEETRMYILQCMQKLWQLHESVQQEERGNTCSVLLSNQAIELTDGMKVLMALRLLETYEEVVFTRNPPSSFYREIFRQYTPSSYAERKLFAPVESPDTTMDDLDVCLLADTLSIHIDLFQPNSILPMCPELERTTNQPRLPLLEPAVDCGVFLPLIHN